MRSFELDSMGREVYDACDGRRDVNSIIRQFAKAHGLGRAEAEMSVTIFLKMLIGKGLIAMGVPAGREGGEDRKGGKRSKVEKKQKVGKGKKR